MSRESQVVRIASCYWWVSCTPLAHRASRSRRVAWQLGADWRCFTGASTVSGSCYLWVAPPYHSRWRSSYTSYFAVSRRLCTLILTHGRFLIVYVYIYCIYWLVVWNIFYFAYTGNNHPNWLIFFRGVETTNQYISLRLFCMIAMR